MSWGGDPRPPPLGLPTYPGLQGMGFLSLFLLKSTDCEPFFGPNGQSDHNPGVNNSIFFEELSTVINGMAPSPPRGKRKCFFLWFFCVFFPFDFGCFFCFFCGFFFASRFFEVHVAFPPPCPPQGCIPPRGCSENVRRSSAPLLAKANPRRPRRRHGRRPARPRTPAGGSGPRWAAALDAAQTIVCANRRAEGGGAGLQLQGGEFCNISYIKSLIYTNKFC